MTETALKSLEREHLFHLLMARNWLAIGSLEEARREFQFLPRDAQMHPEARRVREQLFARSEDDESENEQERPYAYGDWPNPSG